MTAPESDPEEARLEQTEQPARDAMTLHPFYRGKVEVALKAPIRDLDDFAIWYTPGVAAPCKAIAADPEQVYLHTHKGNTVAVVSDGSRVLGLGDIGPLAGLPVMEGKALLFKYLGGVDAWPIMLDVHDPEGIIETVRRIQPGFGGINLEDIAQPKCFQILDALRHELSIPVFHDDQQGTATVMLAGLWNALELVGKSLAEVSILFVGAGAANTAVSQLIFAAGADPGRCRVVDVHGLLHTGREDIRTGLPDTARQWELCGISNTEGRKGGIEEALVGADVVIALSQPGPGTILPAWIEGMAADPIVFACANPTPEIWPWEAAGAGAAVVATGRSDFPNQVNNALGFPGIFRGALDVRAETISHGMCMAAATELARLAKMSGLAPDRILPTIGDWQTAPRVAAAVAAQASQEGLARTPLGYEEELELAGSIILRSRQLTQTMMDEGLIQLP